MQAVYHEVGFPGRKVDNASALACLELGLKHGDEVAGNRLATSYFDGRLGLQKSDKKAMLVYKQCADLGSKSACYNIGTMYDCGQGVPRNLKKVRSTVASTCGLTVTPLGLVSPCHSVCCCHGLFL